MKPHAHPRLSLKGRKWLARSPAEGRDGQRSSSGHLHSEILALASRRFTCLLAAVAKIPGDAAYREPILRAALDALLDFG